MRMWMVEPKNLCRKHLMGEHVEMHMFLGHMKLKRKADGFIKNNLFEPKSLKSRHDVLAEEMLNRGYNHYSPLDSFEFESSLEYLSESQQNHIIDAWLAEEDLLGRCDECKQRKGENNV